MELILWRHADAADGYPDIERPLTDKGIRQAERMAAFLRDKLPKDIRILVSPAKRAQQTAAALARHYITEPAIQPNCSVEDMLTAAGWPDAERDVLIVGHQPVIGATLCSLLCNRYDSFSVKKGAVWWVSRRTRAEDETHLRLSITPDLL